MQHSDNTTIGTETPSKSKSKLRGKKRKRIETITSSDSEDVLPDNVLEVEHNVTASAVKNNLDDISVKKILKKVVTNDHVLALVKLREEEESKIEESGLQPKLTRAKVKELKKVSSTTWNLENLELTPINHIPVKTRPEVKALIAQELHEDEDDEEYQPTNDDVPSDDDQDMESCSDLDSQPRTPATPRSQKGSPRVFKDGPFKIPQNIYTPACRKLDMQEEATIALRTRSKLCLSETPIEHIESSFVPPDDVPLPPGDDHVWNEFLNDFFNPASVSKNEDDDEADPEYNVAADPDAHDEDEEALESTIIKISKKELSDLMTELFNVMPEASVEAELTDMANSVLSEHSHNESTTKWEGKQEPLSEDETPKKQRFIFERKSSPLMSIGKTEPEEEIDYDEAENVPENMQQDKKDTIVQKKSAKYSEKKKSTVVEIRVRDKVMGVAPPPDEYEQPQLLRQAGGEPVQVVLRNDIVIQPEQIQVLQQQLRQHIQIATCNFLQLYVHPLHWTFAPTYKEYLESLLKMAEENPSSVVKVCNLLPAVELVKTWEQTVSEDTPENKAMVEFIQKEADRWRRRAASNNYYVGDFHETLMRVVANSPVFLYPHLLPPMPFRPDILTKRYSYLPAEDELIALGLEQFWQYVAANPQLYQKRARAIGPTQGLAAAAELVTRHMMPWHSTHTLLLHVQRARRRGRHCDNPLARFFRTRKVPPVKHKLLPFNPTMTLYHQPEHEVPRLWVRYLAQSSKRFKAYLNSRPKPIEPTRGVDIDFLPATGVPPAEPLPIEFTDNVTSARIKLSPPKQAEPQDNYDIHIDKPQTVNMYKLVETTNGGTLIPIGIQQNAVIRTPVTPTLVIEPVINRSDATRTVSCNITPINSTVENRTIFGNFENSVKIVSDNTQPEDDEKHCKCCILLRRICRVRQTTIKEFFSNKVKKKKCYCNHIGYPKITNRLRLLVKTYLSSLECASASIEEVMKDVREVGDRTANERLKVADIDETDDVAFVSAFVLKLNLRTTIARNKLLKRKVYRMLSEFKLDSGDPIQLVKELEQAFMGEMLDMNQEIVGFLTPEQAEKIGKYRDYFMQNHLNTLLKKMEEQIQDVACRRDIARLLLSFLGGLRWAACTMCSELLIAMSAYPQLAEYTFSLFPHCSRNLSTRPTESCQKKSQNGAVAEDAIDEEPIDDTLPNDNAEQATMDYEADHSSSGEDEECKTKPDRDKHEFGTTPNTKPEMDVEDVKDSQDLIVNNTEEQDNNSESSNMSMVIVFEEVSIKEEPIEWKRGEDKLILEILQQHLSPKERVDRTILEIIDEKKIVEILADKLTDKSVDDVRDRVLYILKMLACKN